MADLRGSTVHVKTVVEADIELSANDVYNWVLAHNTMADLPMLKTLDKQLQILIRAIEHPDDDDFRSII